MGKRRSMKSGAADRTFAEGIHILPCGKGQFVNLVPSPCRINTSLQNGKLSNIRTLTKKHIKLALLLGSHSDRRDRTDARHRHQHSAGGTPLHHHDETAIKRGALGAHDVTRLKERHNDCGDVRLVRY